MHVPIVVQQVMHAKTVYKHNALPVLGRVAVKAPVHNARPVNIQQQRVQHLTYAKTVRTVNGLMRAEVRHVRIVAKPVIHVKTV